MDRDLWKSKDGKRLLWINTSHSCEFYQTEGKPFLVSTSELKEIADAIYTELGLGWKAYPNKDDSPDPGMVYDITYIDLEGKPTTKPLTFQPELWKTMGVIAYRERPAPYKPESEE